MYNHDEIAQLVAELRTLERIKGRSGAASLEDAIASVQKEILKRSDMQPAIARIEVSNEVIAFPAAQFAIGQCVKEGEQEGIIVGLYFDPDDWMYIVEFSDPDLEDLDCLSYCRASEIKVSDPRKLPLSGGQRQILNGFLHRFTQNSPALESEAVTASSNGKHI